MSRNYASPRDMQKEYSKEIIHSRTELQPNKRKMAESDSLGDTETSQVTDGSPA